MELNELQKHFTLKQIYDVIDDVNPLRVAEKIEFTKAMHWTSKKPLDYRQRAIEHCARNTLPMTSTPDCLYDLCKMVLRMVCPYCESPLEIVNGSRGGGNWSIHLACKSCRAKGFLRLPCDGLTFVPGPVDEESLG